MRLKPRLKTRNVRSGHEIRAFFDQLADHYLEFHGQADRLLCYRLGTVHRLLKGVRRGVLLEIGCGTGLHLFELANEFESLIGIDLSTNMIRVAESKRQRHPAKRRIRLTVDSAETLSTLRDDYVDVVLCVGALEHMPDKQAVLKQVHRVLKPGGAFLCLTPNGGYLWYTVLAPWLGYDTKHLSSDEFLTRAALLTRVDHAGLVSRCVGYWQFVPRGDMPSWMGHLLSGFDRAGQILGLSSLRGGLYLKATREAVRSRSVYSRTAS